MSEKKLSARFGWAALEKSPTFWTLIGILVATLVAIAARFN